MKQFFIRWLFVILVSPGLCFAQAVPTRMQSTVSGIIQQKMASRGFASNDPRWGATLQAGSVTIATAAASAVVVTVAGVTAPAWLTAAGTIALGALFTAGINLAIDGVNWILNSNGSVTTLQSSPASTGSALVAGGPFWTCQMGGDIAATPDAACASGLPRYLAPYIPQYYSQPWTLGAVTNRTDTTIIWNLMYNGAVISNGGAGYSSSGAPASCAPGQVFYGGACTASLAVAPAPALVTTTATVAVGSMSAGDGAKPVNPAVTAAIADAAWKKAAAQSGYLGVPYDAANPITAADAISYQAAFPSSTPTVSDLVAPQAAPSGGTASQPFTLPNSAATPALDPASTTPPVKTPTDGLDWAIPATNDQIPKQEVSISYTPTVFAAPTGCPAPISFSMFGKQYAIAYQPACDLMSTLAPIFLALGAAAAALIFAESLKS